MIRSILLFIVLWVFIHFGIIVFRELTKSQKWTVTKTFVFSVGTAIVTFVILSVFVMVFN